MNSDIMLEYPIDYLKNFEDIEQEYVGLSSKSTIKFEKIVIEPNETKEIKIKVELGKNKGVDRVSISASAELSVTDNDVINIINGDITWIIKLGIIPGLKSMTFKKKYDVDALTEFAEKLKGIGG